MTIGSSGIPAVHTSRAQQQLVTIPYCHNTDQIMFPRHNFNNYNMTEICPVCHPLVQ